MKKILLVACLVSPLDFTGCVNMPAVITALGKDPAAAHIQISSIYVNITIDRANPGTNAMSVGGNGITTKP